MLKLAQQYFQLVGASASHCDTIPGRQCMAMCFFLLKQFDDVLIYLKSIKVCFFLPRFPVWVVLGMFGHENISLLRTLVWESNDSKRAIIASAILPYRYVPESIFKEHPFIVCLTVQHYGCLRLCCCLGLCARAFNMLPTVCIHTCTVMFTFLSVPFACCFCLSSCQI